MTKEELAALDRAATQGTWKIDPCRCGHKSCTRTGTSNGTFYEGSGYEPADAALIVFLVNAYRAGKLVFVEEQP